MRAFWRPDLPAHPEGTSSSDVKSSSKATESMSEVSESPSFSPSKTVTSVSREQEAESEFKKYRSSLWTVDALEKHNRNPHRSLLQATQHGRLSANSLTGYKAQLETVVPRVLRVETKQELTQLAETTKRVEREIKEGEERRKKAEAERLRMQQTREQDRFNLMQRLGLGMAAGADGDIADIPEQFLRNPMLLEILRHQMAGPREDPDEDDDDGGDDMWENASEEEEAQEESEGEQQQ